MQTYIARGVILSICLAVLAGCTNLSKVERQAACIALGAVAGGVAGSSGDDDAVLGTIGGGLAGAAICALLEGDSDGDGVKDSQDQCPATPIGVAVNSQGCALDSDKDGVFNTIDQCPGTPAGQAVTSTGCTPEKKREVVRVLDDDKDGVNNAVDICPDTPKGSVVDAQGCPPVQKIILQGVVFNFDSMTLTEPGKRVLRSQIETLLKNPAAKIEISGHTDDAGSEVYNKNLSQNRAKSVMEYLVSHGVSQRILTAVGYGESKPVADNSTEAGRAENRRVEFKIIRNEG